ncbi:tetratricopeptide repeat protein [Oscillatoria sp. FACHB-1407]|uniref:tetratricopeptide repeat protein n=1 Tax=Oscillatoria sp. FACHB-1407 TaxID=2692847 RepID=UPI00168692F2|nr:tetratricopeptide repeat protein [Oscillatoria sp. FACHB-1407]MBD2461602.1 tetratricopeptide repeat protein [Oscillatoria sp. FACHB-1407]
MKKQRHWLDFAEYASLVGLGVGSVASFVSSQVLYTSAPLSLLVLLNLANRRRFEHLTEQNTAIAITDIDRKLSKNIELLNQQVLSLPTVEAMGSLKKTLLNKNREVLDELSTDINKIKQEVLERFSVLDRQNLGSVRQELIHIQGQYSQLNDAVSHLNTQLSQLSNSKRLDEVESTIAKLKANTLQLRDNLQSLADQTRPTLTSLQDQINHLNRQFQKLPPPFDATALRQEVTELIRVVADLVPKRDWHNLQAEIKALQQQQEARTQSEEALRYKLQELNQQLQKRPEKSSLTALQNQINHLDRQIKKLPPPFDSTSLKREIAQLVKAVGDLVPKRDWGALTAQIKALQQQQEFQKQFETTLRQELQELSQQFQTLSTLSTTELSAAPIRPSEPSFPLTPIAPTTELTLELPVDNTTAHPPGDFQGRIETVLNRELQAIAQQLRELPSGSQLQAQIEATVERELEEVNEQLQAFPASPHYQLVFDFKSSQSTGYRASSNRAALEHALDVTQERLILILPWSNQCPLDQVLLHKLEAFLQRGRRLDVGWCHQANRDEERLLSTINHRWSIHPIQKELQSTLQKLLQLKRTYPQHFQFKVLGTSGNFLVSDQAFAVMGIDEALVSTNSLPEMELKLWTDDPEVIQQCITQFDHPVPNPNDITAYWNQAVTRYDLGDREGAIADFNQVLSINPNDAIAYNYRGLARYDQGDVTGAIADFNRSLHLNPHQVAAYCNRGFIRSEQGDQLGAISDFSLAIEKQPTSAIAYFYRGIADQKYNDPLAAATDFGEAIRLMPDSPMSYYHRGQAYQKLENLRGAIADFEIAARLFTERGNATNAQKASKSAAKLKRLLSQQPANLQPDIVLSTSTPPITNVETTLEPRESVPSENGFFSPAGVFEPANPNDVIRETNGHGAALLEPTNITLEPSSQEESAPAANVAPNTAPVVVNPLFLVDMDDDAVTEILNPPQLPLPIRQEEPSLPPIAVESGESEPDGTEPIGSEAIQIESIAIAPTTESDLVEPPEQQNPLTAVETEVTQSSAPTEAIADNNANAPITDLFDDETDFLAQLAEHLDAQPVVDAPIYQGIETLSNFFYDAEPKQEGMSNGTASLSESQPTGGSNQPDEETTLSRPDQETLAEFSNRFFS